MERPMIHRKKMIYAAGFLLLSTSLAAAAPARVETDLNVRSGEGTAYPVVAVMPAGAIVDVTGCADGWCFVRDYGGFASAAYFDAPGPVYVAPPTTVVVPGPVYREPNYRAGSRIIRRGIREFRRDVREERRDDRRDARRDDRRDSRQDLRQDRRENRREARQDNRREQRQERRENRRD